MAAALTDLVTGTLDMAAYFLTELAPLYALPLGIAAFGAFALLIASLFGRGD